MHTNPPQRGVILALDDDENDIELMRILFRKAGVGQPVEVYRRGEDLMEALTALLRRSLDVVLPLLCFLDVKMPSITGHDVLRWIRQHPELDPIAVVMLSSSEHPADLKQAAEAGAQCYLAKYPPPAVLRQVVEHAEQQARRGAIKEWFGLPSNLLLRALST